MSKIQNLRKFIIAVAVFGIVSLGSAITARADLMILQGASNFGDENVLFNQPGSISGPDLTVSGATQTGFRVNFTSIENLVTPSMGQARVEAQDVSFTNLTISSPDGNFTFISFNLNTLANATGQVTITGFDNGNEFSETFTIDQGQNFFSIEAINGQVITSVVIDSMVEIQDIRQIRVTGGDAGVIPEPATMLLLGTGLLGLAAGARRRNRKR